MTRLRRFAPAAVVVIAAGALSVTGASSLPPPPAPFVVVPEFGGGGIEATTNVFIIARMATIVVTEPFTLVRVTPRYLDPGLELITARIGFHGLTGSRTASRYLRSTTIPLNMCADEPVTGHGETYPAENLRLLPGDTTIRLLFYLRATKPGVLTASGHRIDFVLGDGRTGTVTGDGLSAELTAWTPGTQPPDEDRVRSHCPFDQWTTRAPGYPA